jgi:hypothetical protein
VAQPRQRTAFAQEPHARVLGRGRRRMQHLHRDPAIEIRIVRGPHLAHAALPEQAVEPVLPELLARREPVHAPRIRYLPSVIRVTRSRVMISAQSGG